VNLAKGDAQGYCAYLAPSATDLSKRDSILGLPDSAALDADMLKEKVRSGFMPLTGVLIAYLKDFPPIEK